MVHSITVSPSSHHPAIPRSPSPSSYASDANQSVKSHRPSSPNEQDRTNSTPPPRRRRTAADKKCRIIRSDDDMPVLNSPPSNPLSWLSPRLPNPRRRRPHRSISSPSRARTDHRIPQSSTCTALARPHPRSAGAAGIRQQTSTTSRTKHKAVLDRPGWLGAKPSNVRIACTSSHSNILHALYGYTHTHGGEKLERVGWS